MSHAHNDTQEAILEALRTCEYDYVRDHVALAKLVGKPENEVVEELRDLVARGVVSVIPIGTHQGVTIYKSIRLAT